MEDANSKVIIRTAAFNETELDPQTNWKEDWQNLDSGTSIKGFVETGIPVPVLPDPTDEIPFK